MDWALIVTAIVVIVAIGFDFTNGFHDSAKWLCRFGPG